MRRHARRVRILRYVTLDAMATDAAPTEVAAPRVVDRDVPRPAAPTRPPAAPPRPGPRRAAADRGWGVPLAVLIVGMFMSVLDISIINVAIPTMQRDFAATTDQIQWVENAYSLALGVVVPVSAWMAARFGPGRVYILSLLGLRRRLRAVRAGLGPQQHRRLPGAAGPAGRCAAGGVADDPLPDRPPAPHRRGDGHVRAGHHRGPGGRPDAGRLPGGVRRLAVDLLHQRAGRHPRHGRGGPAPAEVRADAGGPLRRARLPVRGHRAGLPAARADRGPAVGLDLVHDHDPADGRCARPRAVRRDRAGGRRTAAERPRLRALAVHQLAAAGVRAVRRPVRRAVLHPAAAAAGARARRVRHRPAPAAAGPGDGRDHAGGRAALRPDRPAVARGHRAGAGRAGHLPAHRREPREQHLARRLGVGAAGRRDGPGDDADHDGRAVRGAAEPGRRRERVQQRRAADLRGARVGRADLARDLLPRAVRPGPRADGRAGHADARARARADRRAGRHVRGLPADPDAGVRRGDALALHRHGDHHRRGDPARADAPVRPEHPGGRWCGGRRALRCVSREAAVGTGDDPGHPGADAGGRARPRRVPAGGAGRRRGRGGGTVR